MGRTPLDGYDGPVLDNHFHLDDAGANVAAAAEFQRAGGTHLLLVHKPSWHEVDRPTLEESYAATIRMAGRLRAELGLVVGVCLGPHPAFVSVLRDRLSLQERRAFLRMGVELAAQYVQEGEAVAIGEVGRPHYPVPAEEQALSEEALLLAAQRAKEVECPLILHTEEASAQTYAFLAQIADAAGLPRARMVKHFAGPQVLPEENLGLLPSVLASRQNVDAAADKSDRFLLETDYLDDPRRPGAVLGPRSVPKACARLLARGWDSERLCRLHLQGINGLYRLPPGR